MDSQSNEAAASDTRKTPAHIGRYPILGELGHGGMGVVYLAEDPSLKRKIALKVLADRLSRSPESQSRFRSEARLLASLSHPWIATVFALEDDDGTQWITMELVPGECLADLIRDGKVSPDLAIDYCRQIAGAMQAAHARGVVHRDLKPSNIRVTPEGQIKVLDFGLAKLLPDVTAETVSAITSATAPGAILGTPGYASPEQVLGKPVDVRADIFAFGCVLFECLAGAPAFPGESLPQRLINVCTKEPRWSALPQEAASEVRELLGRCLEKNPSKRLGSIAIAGQLLEEQHALHAIRQLDTLRRRDAGSVPNNLPYSLIPFVGRQDQVAGIQRQLKKNRLVTLIGAGGCGKSRLAVEAARSCMSEYADGAWHIDLSGARGADALAASVGSVLGLDPGGLAETLAESLREKRLLLLLDNCDAILSECAELIRSILRASGQTRALSTSRERLRVSGEAVHRVPPFQTPDATGVRVLGDLEEMESVKFFLARARETAGEFELTEQNAEAVAQICHRLDGLPLALQMAASQTGTLPPAEIVAHLDDRFRMLGDAMRDADPRHITLWAACDWSYALLGDQERTLFCALARCDSPWSLDQARACADGGIEGWQVADIVSRLVDKSLIEVDTGRTSSTGRVHYRMLETLRAYAGEKSRQQP